jgi:PAS domain S-box-containing protein
LLDRQRFSAVVLDYHLPDGDAWPVVEAAEGMRPRIPVILVTGHGNELIASQALQRGVASYVKKSGSFWELLPNSLARITDMVEAAERLRASEERFRLMVESVKEHAMFMLDPSGCVTTWNEGAERLKGYTAQEILGKHFSIFYPDEVCAEGKPQRELAVATATGRVEDEGWRLRKGGKRFFANVVISAIRDEGGQLQGFVKVTRDITQRREDAQKLQQISSLLTCILESASEISVISTDPDLNITVFNKGAEHLLGFRFEETVGRATPALFHDADEIRARGEELSLQLGYPVAGGAVFTEPSTLRQAREWTYIRKDGTRVRVSLVVTVMRNPDGGILGYLGIAHDITRQAQYEASLREATSEAKKANGAKSEFLANMSHEIRTPLNAVIGLGYLLEQTTLTEDQGQYVAKIQFAGRSLLSVIDNVLDLSKIEAGQMVLEDESFDLPVMVREVISMLTPQATGKGIELLVVPLSGLTRAVRGDATRLRQILVNLMSNSIKFTGSGQVELKILCTEQDSDRIRLRGEVKDTGIGIEAAALERLFMPFSQADASTTRRYGGTGLGLSISRRCVELMGGKIGVTSTVAVGSTFWFEIPLRKAAAIDKRGAHAEGFRLLVADSNADALDGFGTMVRALGWRTQMVATGARLLEVMQSTPPDAWPDAIILDLHLLAADEVKLIGRLQSECTQADLPPVIIVAGQVESYAQCQPSMRTTDGFLVRPVTSSALFNAINSAVWRHHDTYDRKGHSTSADGMHTQWLAAVRVLVVDDSSINLEVAQRILERQGAIVATCSDGRAAVEYVRANHPSIDLVLMDVQMPILDGNEATRRIRDELELRSMPIVALSAGALVGERQRSIEAGMNDFVSKPFDPLVLIRKVRSIVERARGSPIPLGLVGQRAAPAADRLRIPSIDAAIVQQMFGDDESVFESLLLRLLRDNADLALPSLPVDDETSRTQFQARLHQLKGSAGMIGASEVSRLAAAAETALRQNRPAEALERRLGQLAAALTALREEAELIARRKEPRASAALEAVIRPDIGAAEIDALCLLLESQNLEAVDRFNALSQSMRETMAPERFERLHAAIDQLDFALAADFLRDAPLDRGSPQSAGTIPNCRAMN